VALHFAQVLQVPVEELFSIEMPASASEKSTPVAPLMGPAKSGHSAHTSKLFPLTQQVIKEHEGCLSKKPGPAHPGHLDDPTV
jgi:hypothetical protein